MSRWFRRTNFHTSDNKPKWHRLVEVKTKEEDREWLGQEYTHRVKVLVGACGYEFAYEVALYGPLGTGRVLYRDEVKGKKLRCKKCE